VVVASDNGSSVSTGFAVALYGVPGAVVGFEQDVWHAFEIPPTVEVLLGFRLRRLEPARSARVLDGLSVVGNRPRMNPRTVTWSPMPGIRRHEAKSATAVASMVAARPRHSWLN